MYKSSFILTDASYDLKYILKNNGSLIKQLRFVIVVVVERDNIFSDTFLKHKRLITNVFFKNTYEFSLLNTLKSQRDECKLLFGYLYYFALQVGRLDNFSEKNLMITYFH